ncbi:MAG: U32 family peptidase [Bacteroidales bacterium]|nr:U32 family peptidase [Bacteroidales bacterium]
MASSVKDIEIMSPVGSFESLRAAIQGGAGSVYFGTGRLNMRARSSRNFTLDDLREITAICRREKVKSYLTLNTVIYDEELDEMRGIVDASMENGIDAVIASDLSVIRYARSVGMEVHMSTQTNITNLEAVQYWSQFADVMVTARELSLTQVAAITRAIEERQITGPSGRLVRIEIFVHGALCMAISGKCYLSLDNYNHSANRGECFQLCRRGYRVIDKDGDFELDIDNEYIMSPKDLKTVGFLDKILKAGVKVLKIEGRGRPADYVRTVTKVYKEAVNAYFSGGFTEEKIAAWDEELKTVYNRGFWDGYYLGRKPGEWSESYGSRATRRKTYLGKITNYFNRVGVAELTLEAGDLNTGDQIMVTGETTGVYEKEVDEIRVEMKPVNFASKGQVCSLPAAAVLRRGDKVYKVTRVDPDKEI